MLSLFFSINASADFLGFKTGDSSKGKIPDLVQKLNKLQVEDSPIFEENFNQIVKSIENNMEEEKSFCSGETADAEGKVLTGGNKQLCFRDLKSQYLEAMDTIFTIKKKYLALIHTRQIEKLSEIQKKLKLDIDKSF
ncbi:MAG: hypothetical protein H0V66_15060 [Bdellovibrionales bacterium]|nr:hypothetical protein [Bdellovibrionales bacterium]